MVFLRNETLVEISEIGVPAELNLPKGAGNSLVLVANTHKTVVRVAKLSNISKRGFSVLSQDDEWSLVKNHFPIGEKMNESTHVFDGCIFANKNGQLRFFMTALPISVCNDFAKTGVELTGSIHRVARLDTAEHVLFRQFCEIPPYDEALFIFLPQDNGIRILYISENLPASTHYISNNPTHRRDEFLRFYNAIPNQDEPPKIVMERAVLLIPENIPSPDFEWLHILLSQKDFAITEKLFRL